MTHSQRGRQRKKVGAMEAQELIFAVCHNEDPEVLRAFVEAGADVNAR
jgi:uncharacterized protein YggL (DUF469 family)